MSNRSSTGYRIIHSYPFIEDGPKNNKHYATSCTRQVPPAVMHINPTWKPVKLDEKPLFSYATIIAHAILSSQERRLTLSEIYQWISENYPCYSDKDHRWQNSIRHNLSLQKAFVKIERDSSLPSSRKGCFWTILPDYEQQYIENLLKGGTRIQKKTSSYQSKQYVHHNHLFTIFRMSPTTPTAKRKPNKKHTSLRYDDSDCDSGIDLDCPLIAKREEPNHLVYSNNSRTVFDDIPSSSIILDKDTIFGDPFYVPTTSQWYDEACFYNYATTTSFYY